MKTLKIIIIVLLAISCKAQNPIIDVIGTRMGQPDGYYVKDINNLLNPFEGTYIYTNGNTSFKIVLVKKIQQFNGRYYEDLIIGEYQYIENGIQKVNTLSQLNIVYNDQRSHNIDGNFVVGNRFREWQCPLCIPNEKRLSLSIRDASTNRYAELHMRRTTESGQQVMKIKISHVTGELIVSGTPPPLSFSLPLGEFILIKQ